MIFWHDSINSVWGPRREEPAALAIRVKKLVERLAEIEPSLRSWLLIRANKKTIPFNKIGDRLADEIAARVTRGDFGEPEPIYGYWVDLLNELEDTPKSVSVRAWCGGWSSGVHTTNSIMINTAYRMEPDPSIANYRVFRAALLASAECFDTTFGSAYPTALQEFWLGGGSFRFGWINYVAPRLAHLVTPPKSAIVEYQPNGGLLMSATEETFLVSNPHHMAVARDIEAALAPLNALPCPVGGQDG